MKKKKTGDEEDVENTLLYYSKIPSGLTEEEKKELEAWKEESKKTGFFLKKLHRRETKIRLASAREMFFRGFLDVDEVTDHYKRWRSQDEFLLFLERIEERYKGEIKITGRYRAVKCAKRGNDVYVYRVKKSLVESIGDVPDIIYFNEKDRDLRKKNATTPLLFFTLTYDTKRCGLEEAWQNIGKEYNRWISRVRKKYGKVSVLRTWEAYQNDYPHIHAVLLFHEAEFKVFRHKDKFRIQEKHEFSSMWHSFVDVTAVSRLKKAINYITKYITKELFSEEGTRTVSLLWIFKRRSYSVTKDCFKVLGEHRLESNMHNSNQKSKQVTLLGEEITKVVVYFLGIFTDEELDLSGDEWEVDIPPPTVEKIGINFEDLGRKEED